MLIQSAASVLPFVSPNTPGPTQFAGISMKVILTKAKSKVAEYIRYADDVDRLDLSLMVIQSELGNLVYAKGDLSFLMRRKPVLHKPFYVQLNGDIKYDYDGRQLAVWQQKLADGQQFQVAPNWHAAILPFFAEDECFTVTVFIARKTN